MEVYNIHICAENIDNFALAFVSPLCPQHHHRPDLSIWPRTPMISRPNHIFGLLSLYLADTKVRWRYIAAENILLLVQRDN